MMNTIGNKPYAAPWVADRSDRSIGMLKPMHATRMDTPSATAAAT